MQVSLPKWILKATLILAVWSISLATLQKQSFAGVVTWSTAQLISSDSDVDTNGSLVYAYNFGPSSGASQVQSQTVQGVTFAAFGAQAGETSITLGDVTLSESPGVLEGLDTSANSGSFTSLSTSYKGLVGTAIVASYYAEMNLSLGGLVSGKSYRFQVWINDSTNDILYYQVAANGGGSTVEISANASRALGGLGQYAIGSFTATGSTQEITFDGIAEVVGGTTFIKNPILNAFQLRLESSDQVPEPASVVIFSLGIFAGCVRAARRDRKKSV